MIMKTLTFHTTTQTGVKRMIMQRPGQPPMEMPSFMMNMMQQHNLHPSPVMRATPEWVNWWGRNRLGSRWNV